MKPTLDTKVQDALETAQNLEKITSGSASPLAYSLRQQLDEIVDEIERLKAEETWEYAVQVKIGAKWLFLGRGPGGHNFAKNAFWFEKKEKAQSYAEISTQSPTRVVRRRVSEVEVVDA